jgi:hypothetical protein
LLSLYVAADKAGYLFDSRFRHCITQHNVALQCKKAFPHVAEALFSVRTILEYIKAGAGSQDARSSCCFPEKLNILRFVCK